MSTLGAGDRHSSTRPGVGFSHPHQVEQRRGAADRLGAGSIACPLCDAPVSIGTDPLAPAQLLACPFCDHRAPLRDFLSLTLPTRPARVVVRVRRRI